MRRAGILMRIGLGLCIAALFLGSCRAQIVKTVVSGTIVDPNGVPYAGGSIDATLVPVGTTPTVAGFGQIDGYVQPVAISKTGAFTLPLYCNNASGGCSVISPASTQWMFTVRNPGATPPVGFGGISFTVTLTITGATQSITSQLQAAAPPLAVFGAASAGCSASGTAGNLLLVAGTGSGCTNSDKLNYNSATDTLSFTPAIQTFVAPTGIAIGAGNGSNAISIDLVNGVQIAATNATGNAILLVAGSSLSFVSTNFNVNGGSELDLGGVGPGAGILGLVGSVSGKCTLAVNPTGSSVASSCPMTGAGVTLAAAGVNTTPVTAAANTTGFQNLQTVAYTAGSVNSLGKSFRVHAGGTLAVVTGGAVKAQIAINIQTVQATNISSFSPATTGTYSWSADFTCTVLTTGPSGSMICDGTENFGGVSGVPAQLDNATFPFTKTISANLQTDTGPLLQAQFSTGSTSNTMTSNVMSLEFLN